MDKALIHDYFRKGLDRGLSIDYIRDVLLSKGYDQQAVDYVYKTIINPSQYGADSTKPLQGSKWLKIIPPIFLLMIIAVFAGYFIWGGNDGVTGMAVQNPEERLDQISQLDKQIDQQSSNLQIEIDALKQANITIEEKNKRINELVSELDSLHKSISNEHEQVRSLLWDLLKTILKRGEKAVEPASGQTSEGQLNPEEY